MDKKLNFSAYAIIGTMLFGLFFGAGNLIFPLLLGQQAGEHVYFAIAGFLISGIGLPFLGVLAVGYSNTKNLQELAGRVHPVYGVLFTVTLYLVIGPLFALPRTGTVSYEIGVSSFVSKDYQQVGLVIYTIMYFVLTLYFALNPAKVIVWIGKILTPLFLLFLGAIIVLAIMIPMGQPSIATGKYIDTAFSSGFLEGYNTMDALASLAFGMLVVDAVKRFGVCTPKMIVSTTAKAGLVGVLLMGILYVAFAYVGASSISTVGSQENGGLVLAKVVQHYFGSFGNIFLAILVFLACITTAIGLVSACASCFHHYVPKISYKVFAIIISTMATFTANIGLTNIINFAIPILMLIYPLTIALIVLTFLNPYFIRQQMVYVVTIICTVMISMIEALKSVTMIFTSLQVPSFMGKLFSLYDHLPFASMGLGWIVPMVLGLLLGWGSGYFRQTK
ncbi:branched-chain amino acid transport system II carrier protein [Neisseria sp. Ec49-e6-T10]|uniref:branched-chain amino acid transport system II carrier protein n=1 Tax=Neisseria sp. Ec49-e6-T10 TaxID=3140744 RepID=UPI003EBFDA14